MHNIQSLQYLPRFWIYEGTQKLEDDFKSQQSICLLRTYNISKHIALF